MKTILLTSLALFLLTFTARAQNCSIDWYKVSGGGGTSTGAAYSVSGTVGQHDAGGPMTGGNFSLTGGFWALVQVVPTPGAPTLYIMQAGTNAVLYWPASASGFLLEHKANLATAGGWSVGSPPHATFDGFNYVTNPITPGNTFYRLQHQ